MELLAQPGVRHHQPAAVQHVVPDQPVHEAGGRRDELIRLPLQLRERLGQPVAAPHVASAQCPDQLHLVVAGDRQRHAIRNHPHGQPQHARGVRATVDQVTEEHRRPPGRVRGGHRSPGLVVDQPPAQLDQQRAQLVEAAVHVADQVERPGELAPVVVRAGPDDRRGIHLVRGGQYVHGPEPLGLELAHRASRLVALAADHGRAEPGPGQAHRLRQVQHDRHRQHVVLPGQLDQARPGGALGVGGVDHGQPAPAQPDRNEVVQRVERVGRGALVGGVVGDQATEHVGRQRLGGQEVSAGERRLARPAGPDHQHQRQLRDRQLHQRVPRLNTASWVGCPSSGSGSPIPSRRTRYPCRPATEEHQVANAARVHSKRWSGCRTAPGANPG